jgi:hypothetical protein
MMARPRKTIVSLDDTTFYHCCSRVVRKEFLFWIDSRNGDNFEHRRAWVEGRMFLLADVFAMDICAYAVMSNHLHIVLRLDAEQAKRWSDKEVLIQWHKGFNGTLLTHSFVKDEALDEFELKTVIDSIAVYRERLTDISWFMRALNEPIARMANREDGCTGRFYSPPSLALNLRAS